MAGTATSRTTAEGGGHGVDVDGVGVDAVLHLEADHEGPEDGGQGVGVGHRAR